MAMRPKPWRSARDLPTPCKFALNLQRQQQQQFFSCLIVCHGVPLNQLFPVDIFRRPRTHLDLQVANAGRELCKPAPRSATTIAFEPTRFCCKHSCSSLSQLPKPCKPKPCKSKLCSPPRRGSSRRWRSAVRAPCRQPGAFGKNLPKLLIKLASRHYLILGGLKLVWRFVWFGWDWNRRPAWPMF